jgi:iron complex transport system substrate-binding protein
MTSRTRVSAPEPGGQHASRGRAPWFLFGLWLCLPPAAASDVGPGIVVVDDRGRTVQLAGPAQRIVSLAPHLTELLFVVGAGERIVATVAHADFPAEAQDIPRVGTATQLDLERLLGAHPDLVIAWDSGSPRAQTGRLEELGVTVYYNEPGDFDGIARDLRRLGRLAGTDEPAGQAAADFLNTIDTLRRLYADRPPVPLFYQVWDQPLMTINDAHPIGEAVRLCGGQNVFGHLDTLVPRPGLEVVLAADPEAIVSGGPGEDQADWLDPWRQWGNLTAVRRDNLFFIPPSLIQRATPRIAEGTRMLCEVLETARTRRPRTEP